MPPSFFQPPANFPQSLRVVLILSVIWVSVLSLAFSLHLFTEVEESVQDHLQRLPAPRPGSVDLALIDIEHVPSDRPWPWPRLDYALILDGLKPQHPQSVVFEMLLHDEDARYTAFDTIFADQVSVLGKVLFSAAVLRPDDASPPPSGLVPLHSEGNFTTLSPFGSFFWPVPTFSTLGQVGICNLSAEKNRNLRTVELVFRYREQLIPSLSLWAAALRLNADLSHTTVRLGHEIVLRDAGDAVLRRIPIDEEGRLRLRFRRPAPPLPRINSDDLVLSADQADRGVNAQADLSPLLHRQVWVGATDRSVVPLLATVNGPTAPVGIQMQATQQIISGDFVHPVPLVACWALFWVTGLGLSRLFVTRGIREGLLAVTVAGLLILISGALLFQAANLSLPLGTTAILLAGVVICGLAARWWEAAPASLPDPQMPLDFRSPSPKE